MMSILRYIQTFSFVFLILFCTACQDEDPTVIIPPGGNQSGEQGDENQNNNQNDNIKDVTFLIYMVGENDLAGLLTENVNDLMVGLLKTNVDANVLVYADISKSPELYYLQKNNGNVIKRTIKTYPDQYSVDPKVMKDVITDIVTKYPARKYAVTFSSHADGSLYTGNVVQKRSFGYEGNQGYGMNITDIRYALSSLPKFELIMFDACLMSSIETVYEFKDLTHYFLAAPNSIPGEGFPYDKILPSLLTLNNQGMSEVASIYMDHYTTNNAEWDNFVSICASDATKIDSLAIYMDSLFQDEVISSRPLTISRNNLQNFENGYPLYDYGHWVDSIGKGSQYLSVVKRMLDKVVVYKKHNGYTTVNDYTAKLENPISDERFSGFNTYVHSTSVHSEGAFKQYFTRLKWYKDAGFWRVPYYSSYK